MATFAAAAAAAAAATASMLSVGSLAAASASEPAPSASTMRALAQCESGGDYATDTGNGYYGAYQFLLATWHRLGLSGLPSQASPATQDAAALALWQESGWTSWPGCSASLGLSPGSESAAAVPAADGANSDPTGPRPRAGTGPRSRYTVKAGDTLSAIAEHFGLNTASLGLVNHITNLNLLQIGQILKV